MIEKYKFSIGDVLICPEDGEIIRIIDITPDRLLHPYDTRIIKKPINNFNELNKIFDFENTYQLYPQADTPLWKLLNE